MRLLAYPILFLTANAMTCDFVRTVYNDFSCCDNSTSDTCLRIIPLCSDVSSGVCDDSGTVKVKGSSYNDLTDKPTLVTSYNNLTDTPTLFSGNYSDQRTLQT